MILLFLMTCPLILKNSKCFLKCREYGISLNLDKCAFMLCSWTILGFIVSKEGKIFNPKNVQALVKMLIPKTPQEIQVFNGMAQFYRCFNKKFAFVMAPITKLLRKTKVFKWIIECQTTWEDIKNQFFQTPIFISRN
jgi:hypothetical protein